MVGAYQIELRENGSSLERCREIINMWDRVAVFGRVLIQGTAVSKWAAVSGCGLVDHLKGQDPEDFRPADDAQFEHVL